MDRDETRKGAATLRDVWRSGAARLKTAGVEEAELDAELLLLHLLGKSKAELLRDWREPWPVETPELAEAWDAMLRRRAAGEPVQYVTGEQHFYGRPFHVGPAVLIPRPETELLVEAILAAGDLIWPGNGEAGIDVRESRTPDIGGPGAPSLPASAPHVLDVGSGSGAIAVTIALERPDWQVTASDLSTDALKAARRNASALGAGERVRFVQGNLLEPFLPGHGRPIHILVSNPPYIPTGDLPGLQREVRDFEPRLALDGGDDGLEPYRRMVEQLRLLPALPRIVGWEVGAGQAEEVAQLLRQAAEWSDIRFITDYAGIRRHVVAVRKS